ncbi:hypothetical protein QFZ22_004593 [Streptomyces canus]|uniref:Uncharacterized protein n=1 Tax=Streptomyces canus TaxID=58343 RepID=A0AAW8FFJ3_9ACTN|nr:hypothetical protein [Streptomyces canus]
MEPAVLGTNLRPAWWTNPFGSPPASPAGRAAHSRREGGPRPDPHQDPRARRVPSRSALPGVRPRPARPTACRRPLLRGGHHDSRRNGSPWTGRAPTARAGRSTGRRPAPGSARPPSPQQNRPPRRTAPTGSPRCLSPTSSARRPPRLPPERLPLDRPSPNRTRRPEHWPGLRELGLTKARAHISGLDGIEDFSAPACRLPALRSVTLLGVRGLSVSLDPLAKRSRSRSPWSSAEKGAGASKSTGPFWRRPEAYASLLRFGPAPPAACSIGGTSGSAAFSSPRKVKVWVSPSPSVSTTTM